MELKSEIENYKRLGYNPIVSKNDIESLLDSKFGGKPFISLSHSWPICECGESMAFFLQLNSNHLPSKLNKSDVFGEGILQLFYCINCDDYRPYSKSCKIRVIKLDELNSFENSTENSNEIQSNFEYSKIIDWEEFIDYPRGCEINFSEDLTHEKLEQYEEREEYQTKSGEKLLGWPLWIQGVEYVNCQICSKPMKYLFQLDSNCNIKFNFGDVGAGHISQCEYHREQIVFTWACY